MPATVAHLSAALRTAKLADAEGILALYREVWEEGVKEDVQSWLESGGGLVLEDGGRIVSALIWREEAGGWRLGPLATLPDYRGQGFGRWLMTKVEALAIKNNVPGLFLDLDGEQDELRRYYGRMGYKSNGNGVLSKPLGGTWQVKGRA